MDDVRLDDLLALASPAPSAADAGVRAALDDLVRAAEPPVPLRRRVPRSVVAGAAVALTLGLGATAAADGYLPYAQSPWGNVQLADGGQCRLSFTATEQVEFTGVEDAMVPGPEERSAVLAAQTFLDSFDLDSIDVAAAVREAKTDIASEQAKVPAEEWAPMTAGDIELAAIISQTAERMKADLAAQGFDPNAVGIRTTHECRDAG